MTAISSCGEYDRQSHGDVDRNSDSGIVPVVHVVAVIVVVDINIVVVVPIVRPVPRPRIEHRYPIALVLESWVPVICSEGKTEYTKSMLRSKVSAIAFVRDPIAVITAALLPRAMI